MAPGKGVGVQRKEVTGLLEPRDQRGVLFDRTIAPVNLVRLGVPGHFFHPLHQRCRGCFEGHHHE
jgi:hypothetical protein